MSRWEVGPQVTLDSLMAEWRETVAPTVAERTAAGMYKDHAKPIIAFFKDNPREMTVANLAAYGRHRLGEVFRGTVQKELSTLRAFLSWCAEAGHLAGDAPEVKKLPKKAAGTRTRPKRKHVILTPEQAWGVIALLPKWASAIGGEPYPVQARFVFGFGLAMRVSMIGRLAAGVHYAKGWKYLVITEDIDKNRYARELPIPPRVRAALDEVCPREGLIFGSHDYRVPLGNAAMKAAENGLITYDQATRLSQCDLRHSRATELVPLGKKGAQHLLGHTQDSTTDIYVHPQLRDAEKLLAEASVTPTRKRRGLVGVRDVTDIPAVCAKNESRTRTAFRPPEPESSVAPSIYDRARALLRAATEDASVADSEFVAFARDALRTTELGRLALGVIDGGPFAPLRAVQLARLIVLSDPLGLSGLDKAL